MRDYLELTKPRITLLILMCTAIGYWFGSGASFHWAILAHTLLGTALLASGTSALDHGTKSTPMRKCAVRAGDLFPLDGSTEQTGSFSACCYRAQASQTYG